VFLVGGSPGNPAPKLAAAGALPKPLVLAMGCVAGVGMLGAADTAGGKDVAGGVVVAFVALPASFS